MKKLVSTIIISFFFIVVSSNFSYAEEKSVTNFDLINNTVTTEIIEDVDLDDFGLKGSEPTEAFDDNWSNGTMKADERAIIGKDDRYRVNTTSNPYNKIVRLGFSDYKGNYTGTGFLVSPDTVVTAAHTVIENGKLTSDSPLYIQPGYDNGYLPYGQTLATNIHYYDAWSVYGDSEYDIAVIKLASNIGNRTGYFGIQKVIPSYATIAGYPGANIDYQTNKVGKMYAHSGSVSKYGNSENLLTYKIDTTPGNSGSPIFNNNIVYGVHTSGNSEANFGVRFNQTFYNWIGTLAKASPLAKKTNKMVVIKSPNYNIWQNFVTWKKKSDTSNKKGNTYRVKYEYDHFNGDTYYSLYDSNDNWQGYINKTGVQELKAESFNKKVSIRSESYNLWQNFFWKKKSDTSGKLGRVYDAKYKYKHYNGETYYSLYDGNGTWQGYINSGGTVELNAVSYNKKVTITKSTYNIWGNFFFNTKKGHTSNHVGKSYNAKYVYTLGDGVKYYSLYNGDTWLGYLNTGATQLTRSLFEGDDDKYDDNSSQETESSNNEDNIDPIELEDEETISSTSSTDEESLNSSEADLEQTIESTDN